MTDRPYGRGGAWQPRAGELNDWTQASRRVLRDEQTVDPGAAYRFRDRDLLLVRNDIGADIAVGEAVGIGSMVFAFSDGVGAWRTNPAVVAETPDIETHGAKWGIAVEPIADGRFGRIALSGVVAIRIDAAAGDAQYATIKDGSRVLEACSGGRLRILASDTGAKSDPRDALAMFVEGPVTRRGIITGNSGALGTAYTVADRERDETLGAGSGGWGSVSGGQSFDAYNGWENYPDRGDDGGSDASGATSTAVRIPVGKPVDCVLGDSGLWEFTIPNGFDVVCS